MLIKESFEDLDEMRDIVERIERDGFSKQIDSIDWDNKEIIYHNDFKKTLDWMGVEKWI
jgi:hypothetical protein